MVCRGGDITRRALLLAAAWAPFAGAASAARAIDRAARGYARLIVDARRQGGLFPPASRIEPGMSEARAYEYQAAVVSAMLQRDRVAGIKGGGMTRPSQIRLGGGPIFGVLFRSGSLRPGSTLKLSDYRKLAIETEIGFELGRRIAAPLPDVQALRRHVAAVRPVVELPDNAMEGDGRFTATDLIACNILSRSFIAGPGVAPGALNLDSLAIRLTLDGAEVHRAIGSDTYESQWNALLWLVNKAVRQRGPLERGCLIITGALGGALGAKTGRYEADFGALGSVSFSVAA